MWDFTRHPTNGSNNSSSNLNIALAIFICKMICFVGCARDNAMDPRSPQHGSALAVETLRGTIAHLSGSIGKRTCRFQDCHHGLAVLTFFH